MNRKMKGLIGQSEVTSFLLKQEYDVFVPFDGNNAWFDLIAYKNNKLFRVWVRSTAASASKLSWSVSLRNVSRRNNGRIVVKEFDNKRCDLVAIYIIPEDRVVMFNSKLVKCRSVLSIPKV